MMNPTTLHILEPIPKRREDPRVTANIAIADSLKALDFNRPNREEPNKVSPESWFETF